MVAAGLLAFGGEETRADTADASAVQQASYSTGKSGARLKWLPQRSAVQRATVGDSEPSEDSCGVRAVQNQQPADNALGDPSSAKNENVKKTSPTPDETLLNGKLQPIAPDKGKTPARSTLLEEQFGAKQFSLKEGCPSPNDLKHIAELNTNIVPSEGDLPRDCPLGNDVFRPRSFAPITYTWTASALCHKPLYFEDEQLERYGHMAGPWLQPFASAANFFLTIPILPYKMGLEMPNECVYTLGYYRSGSCAPYLFDPLPLSLRGALFEGGAVVGAAAILP